MIELLLFNTLSQVNLQVNPQVIEIILEIFLILSSFITILNNNNQIGNRKKVKIGLSVRTENRTQYKGYQKDITIELFNYGISPIFIKYCWMAIIVHKKIYRKNVKFQTNDGFIRPGECIILSSENLNEAAKKLYFDINNEYGAKLYIIIENGMGKEKKLKTDLTLSDVMNH